jgi:NurA domain
MSLDLSKIIGQIVDLAANIRQKETQRKSKIEFALKALESAAGDVSALRQRVESSKTTWLVAGPKENIDLRQPAKDCYPDYIAVASDGSHIDVDRHQSAHCFLINIGMARLQYGTNPDAELYSLPQLYFKDEEVVITSADGRKVPIEGQLLGIKRTIEECRMLIKCLEEIESPVPVILLLDGSLVLWSLSEQVYPDFVVHELLVDGFLKHLDELRQFGRKRLSGVASYISFPRSTDVVNLLRLSLCPHKEVDCDRHCSGKFSTRECEKVGGLLDRELFYQLLAPGERSASFGSRSSVVTKHYGANEINFFYIRLGREVARVEIPLWIAENDMLVEFVHSAILDQCRRGLEYPISLSEAHEQAVVNVADRQQFWNLVEQVLGEGGIAINSSAKSESKRARWI